jgi:selenocysteine-specific elongation factor
VVLDPSPSGRRPEPAWLEALEAGDWGRVVPLALARDPWRSRGMTAEELSLVVSVAPEEIPASVANNPDIAGLGRLYALTSETEAARERLLEALEKRSRKQPESPELSVAEARTATGFDLRLADALLAHMSGAEEPEVSVTDSGVSLPGTAGVPQELEREAGTLLDELRRAADEPPAVGETSAARLLLKRGEAVRLGVGLLAAAGVADEIVAAVEAACREEGEITLARFRDRLGTTRKFAQAWLEYADDAGVTRRLGDVRVLTRRYR